MRTKLADGTFTMAGPVAWNILPSDLRSPELCIKNCFYRISKLTCTIDILTALWIFKFF